MRKQTAAIVFVFLFLALPWRAMAQYTTASLSGNVRDASSALVTSARVTVLNTASGFKQTTDTNAEGVFEFPRLPVGEYRLTVESPGFKAFEQKGITLSVNQSATLDVTLQVGAVTERVEVESNVQTVNLENGTNSQLITTRDIVDLPLNGRTAQSLLLLAPGTFDLGRNGCVICGQGGVYPLGEQTSSVNGSTRTQVYYLMDGISHNDTYLNANLPFPNPDAVQEFNLQAANFSAEYGNAVGGVVNIVTRSGSNEIHGSAFEFLRNGVVNARNFFAPTPDTLKRNQFGGAAGGPIRKNRLFYFGTYQGTRIRQTPSGLLAFVPTAAERAGNFSATTKQLVDPVTGQPFPGNQIPASRISSVAQYFLKSIPLPNGPGRQLTFPGVPAPQDENQYMAKIDYTSGRNQIGGRYYFTKFNAPPTIPASNVLASVSSGNEVKVETFSLNHTFTVSPTFLFTTTFGWNSQTGGSLSGAPFGFPDAGVLIAAQKPPELSLSVTSGFSISTGHQGTFNRGDYSFREVGTKIVGSHTIRAGGELLHLYNTLVNTFQQSGSFTFSGQLSGDGVADFLLGRASNFSQGGGEYKNLDGIRASLFIQDDWRVSPRLTVNLGLRWEPWIPYADTEGRAVCFQPGVQSIRYPNAPLGLTFGGSHNDPGCPIAGAQNNWGNTAPRFGFAYRLTNDGKTSLRGGIGIYFVPLETTDYNVYADTAPFAPSFNFFNVDFHDPYGSLGVTNPFPAQYGPAVPGSNVAFTLPVSVRAVFAPDFHIPQLYSWNLTVERQLAKDWVLRASYVGNRAIHLSEFIFREANPAIYIPGQSTVANTQARRQYQAFSNVGLIQSGNTSHYEAFEVGGEKRFGRGFSLLANYTFSESKDDLGWSDPYLRSHDYGRSSQDIPHNFKFSALWAIPQIPLHKVAGALVNGWSLNALTTWQSGIPINITSGVDNSFSGVGRDRADYLGGNLYLSGQTRGQQIQKWFNTAQFTTNAVGTFGDAPRNYLRGPGFFDTDFSVIKNTRFAEKYSLQFRGEFFNFFNNVNFRQPNSNRSSAQFGQITAANDPRILQGALKLTF